MPIFEQVDMKKLLLSILTILYLVSTTGAMLETHFCMGEVADWSLGDSTGEKCGICGMQKSAGQDNGCCSDRENFLKITDDQKSQAGINAPILSPLIALHPRPYIDGASLMLTGSGQIRILNHLRSPGAPRHVLISVFRI